MRKLILLLLVVVFFCNGSRAQWYERETGVLLSDTDWRKASSGFGAALLLSDNPRALFDEWSNSPESHAPILPTLNPTSKIKRGDVITAVIVFSGCGQAGASCAAMADFRTLKPDRSVYADSPKNRMWSRAAPKSGNVMLSEAYLQIRIEPEDPIGIYQVQAIVTEPRSKAKLKLTQEFSVIP